MDDKGHKKLIKDLVRLYREARAYQFHDFRNTIHPAPKKALAHRFETLRINVIEGKYDN